MRHSSFLCSLVLVAASLLAGCRSRENPRVIVRDPSAAPETLGPGDLRIYNVDSSVDLVLAGDHISAGLSERVVNDVRNQSARDAQSDSGLGGAIASIVHTTIAHAIGTRMQYPVADVRDVHYANGDLVFDWKDGHSRDLFMNGRKDGSMRDKGFGEADAQRFIQAVRLRKKELGN